MEMTKALEILKKHFCVIKYFIVIFIIHGQHEWQLAINKYHLTMSSVLDAGSVLPDFW